MPFGTSPGEGLESMRRFGGEAGVGRREVISRLGSVVAVGFAGGCGGGEEGSPTSSSSSASSSTSSSSTASTNALCVVTPALGVYSDVSAQRTVGQAFLRGYQISDQSGNVRFTTIYPGWYQGRAVHIHFKVRTSPTGASGLEFTSQLFFDEALTDQVHAQSPYSQKGRRDTLITTDGIFRSGGTSLLVPLAASGGGYAGTMYVGVRA